MANHLLSQPYLWPAMMTYHIGHTFGRPYRPSNGRPLWPAKPTLPHTSHMTELLYYVCTASRLRIHEEECSNVERSQRMNVWPGHRNLRAGDAVLGDFIPGGAGGGVTSEVSKASPGRGMSGFLNISIRSSSFAPPPPPRPLEAAVLVCLVLIDKTICIYIPCLAGRHRRNRAGVGAVVIAVEVGVVRRS